MFDQSVLVVRGGALGDLVLTLPIIRALRAKFAKVDVLTNRTLAEMNPGTAPGALDDAELAAFFSPRADLPSRWRNYFSRYQLVLSYLHDPDGTFRANVRACGVRDFVAGPYKIEPGRHATEQLASPLRRFGLPLVDAAPRIELSKEERARTEFHHKSPLIAVHAGSGSRRKNWPIQNWLALMGDLLLRNLSLVVIAGEADHAEIAAIRRRFDDEVDYAVNWPLRKLAALLSATIFIGQDSGVSHLAAACGGRSLVLFGPTDPEIWGPRNENARIVFVPDGDLRRLPIETVRVWLDQELMRIGIST